MLMAKAVESSVGCSVSQFPSLPSVFSECCRGSPHHFLAECHKRQLNQSSADVCR